MSGFNQRWDVVLDTTLSPDAEMVPHTQWQDVLAKYDNALQVKDKGKGKLPTLDRQVALQKLDHSKSWF